MHFEGDLLVCPVKTSVEVVELVREGGRAGWGHSTGCLGVLKSVMVCVCLATCAGGPRRRSALRSSVCMCA